MILENPREDQIFLSTEECRFSYHDLAQKVASLSAVLATIPTSKAFVVEAANGLETYAKFLSLLKSGHTVFLVPEYQFKDSHFRSFLEGETKTSFIYWAKASELSELLTHDLGSSQHPLLVGPMARREARFLVRTSGSSGKKFKFILHDPLLFIKKYQRIGNHFEKTFAFSPAESIAGIETLLETVCHSNELVCAGDRVSPRTVTDLVQKYQVDYFQTTPTFLNLWMMSGELSPEKLGSLKKIAFGSEPPQRVVLNFLREKLPGIQLVHTYGMSEIGIQKTHTSLEDPTLLLLDEDFNPGRLVDGMIEVRSLTPMVSYLNHASEDSAWFKTLDQAVEEKNFWRVKGRNSDMINLAGRKFFPIELEEILMDLAGVLDVSVAREENEIIGNIVVVTINIAPECNETDFRRSLKAFCHERIPYYMHPQKVFLKKEIPINPRFKKIRTT